MNLRYLLILLANALVTFCFSQTPSRLVNNKSQPLLFLENKGQVLDFDGSQRKDILYLMRGQGVTVFIGKGELHYLFTQSTPKPLEEKEHQLKPMSYEGLESTPYFDTAETIVETYRLDVALLGMNPNATVEALDKNEYYENYYNTPGHYDEGILNVQSFGKIIIKNVYPSVDWILYSKNGKLKHDFLLHPGADVRNIKFKVSGATALTISETGDLLLGTPFGVIVEDKPFIPENPSIGATFKASQIGEQLYEVGYSLSGIEQISSMLTIDPGVDWSTYFGGDDNDWGTSVSTYDDKVYFGGTTRSTTNISHKGFQSARSGTVDWFITQFSEDGYRKWATYFGGITIEILYSLKAHKTGVLACGMTHSPGIGKFGFDTTYTPNAGDGLILSLAPDGKRKWSSYLGGLGEEYVNDIDLLANGSIAVTGYSSSDSLATPGVHQTVNRKSYDAFVACVDSSGKSLTWLSYFGGSHYEFSRSVYCKGNSIFIVGTTGSSSYIAYKGFQDTLGGALDGFIAQFDSLGNRVWSSYYGASKDDGIRDMTFFGESIYFTAYSLSASGLGFGGAYKMSGDNYNAMLARISSKGQMIWSSYFGDINEQDPRSLVVDKNGIIWWFIGSSGGQKNLGKNSYFDSPLGFYAGEYLLVQFDTSCRYLEGTYYYGLTDPINGYPSSGIAYDGDNAVYTCSSDKGSGFTVRSKYQQYQNSLADAMFIKWSVTNVSRPKFLTTTPICQGDKLKYTCFQSIKGKDTSAKTYYELSDTNGLFNHNTIVIASRKSGSSRHDTLTWSVGGNINPGKNYRIRAIMSNPSDTSESSDPFEIRSTPTGQILPVSKKQMCLGDSIKIELDTIGPNRVRWMYKSLPTPNASDTNKYYYTKFTGQYYALLTGPSGCNYPTPAVNITAMPQPKAKFSISDSSLCFESHNLTFTNNSEGNIGDSIVSLIWKFGDGQNSTIANPTHSYNKTGTYVVELYINTKLGCLDTAYQTIHLWPTPKVKIHTPTDAQCFLGNSFEFIDSTIVVGDSIVKHNWSIGGNTVGTSPKLIRSFGSTGYWTVNLSVTTSHNCNGNSDKTVKVASTPYAEIKASKKGFCPGDSVKLEVTNPSGLNYQWYESSKKLDGQTKVSWYAKAAGTYLVNVANNEGCNTTSNSEQVVAFVNPVPKLGPDKNLNYDSAITLTPGIFKTYMWYNGATTKTITLNKSTLIIGGNNIWVDVVDTVGCKGSDSVVITLEPINGLNRLSHLGVRVFPIPASTHLNIETPASSKIHSNIANYTISLLDGRIFKQGNLESKITSIQISELAPGAYILELYIDGQKYSVNFLKN